MMLKRFLSSLVIALACAGAFGVSAQAQNGCPYIAQGAVLTAGQWNQCFANKQDSLGYVPVNKAGDIMLGKLTMLQPTTAGAGLNLPQGTAPATPNNGDVWTTLTGMYVRINGSTIGPLGAISAASFAATAPLGVTFPAGVVTYALAYDANFTTTTSQLALATGGLALPPSVTGGAKGSGSINLGGSLYNNNVAPTGSGGGYVLATAPTISALTVTGSFTATGLVTNADLANSSTTVNGQVCTLGSTCTITASAGTITIGITTIASGTTTRILFNNAGTLGEYVISGSGNVAMTTSPVFTTPNLGTPSALVLTNATGTPTSIGLANGSGLPVSTGISGFGTGVATALAVNVGSAGAFVTFNGALGTPSSGTLTNATGLPVGGITGFGTGIATWLATPSSANLAAAVTDETGSGALVFANTPTLVTPNIGAATGTSLNLSGLTASQPVFTDGSKNLVSASAATFTAYGNVFSAGAKGLAPDPVTITGQVLSDGGWIPAPGGTGTVTSVDASGGVQTISGSAITGTGTIRGASLVNAQTGTTYTYVDGDRAKLVTHTNAASIAGTLPQAGGGGSFISGWHVDVQNRGAGTLTITPSTSTIDGAASLSLTTNQGVRIFSDGTNYFSQRGKEQTTTTGTVTSITCNGGLTGGAITTSGTCAADIATASNYYSATANKILDAAVVYTSEVTVTYGTTTTFDFNNFNNAVVTLTGNITTMTFSNARAGKAGTIRFIQDSGGSKTTVWNSALKWASGSAPTLSTAANAVDVLNYFCISSTYCVGALIKAVS